MCRSPCNLDGIAGSLNGFGASDVSGEGGVDFVTAVKDRFRVKLLASCHCCCVAMFKRS